MEIKFYTPEYETIPTRLRVKVNGKYDVYYERLRDKFGWRFEFFKYQGVTVEIATAIVDEMVSQMISQSYDHGAQWRECGVRDVLNDDFDLSITVFLRVRDAG